MFVDSILKETVLNDLINSSDPLLPLPACVLSETALGLDGQRPRRSSTGSSRSHRPSDRGVLGRRSVSASPVSVVNGRYSLLIRSRSVWSGVLDSSSQSRLRRSFPERLVGPWTVWGRDSVLSQKME